MQTLKEKVSKFWQEKAPKLIHHQNILHDHRLGYIYLIEGDKDVTKIGITRGSPEDRCKEISRNFFDRDVYLRAWFFTNCISTLEKYMHDCFKDFRIKGEWFKLPWKEIDETTNKFIHWCHLESNCKEQYQWGPYHINSGD